MVYFLIKHKDGTRGACCASNAAIYSSLKMTCEMNGDQLVPCLKEDYDHVQKESEEC